LEKTDISPKIVDDFFANLIKYNRIEQRIVYTFWGGEPLLNFDMIKYIVKNYGNFKVNEKSVECNFIIISNGTLINKEIAAFCSENNISIQITIDGDKESHDKLRTFSSGRGSYNKIISNIKLLQRQKVRYVIRSTLTSSSLLPSEIIDLCMGHGFNNNAFATVSSTSIYKDSMQPDFIKKVANDYFDAYEKQVLKKNDFHSTQLLNFKKTLLSKKATASCGLSRNRICVRHDGLLFPCHRFVKLDELSIGNVWEDISYDNTVLSMVELNPKCKVCSFKYFCGGSCVFEAFINKDFSYLGNYCLFNQELIKRTFKQLINKHEFKIQENTTSIMINVNIHSNVVYARSKYVELIDLIDDGIIFDKRKIEDKSQLSKIILLLRRID